MRCASARAAAKLGHRRRRSLLLTALGLGMFCGTVAAAQMTIVPVSGTVGGAPELVAFTGNLHIRSTLVKDPDFGKPPTVQLAIDLVDIVGKGLTSGARYVSTAEFHNSTELEAHEVIEMTFPFQPASSKGHLVARAGMMALTLKFDARNGAITGAHCRISGVD